jgi:TRAP transporter 4TM/12TM fusion protein
VANDKSLRLTRTGSVLLSVVCVMYVTHLLEPLGIYYLPVVHGAIFMAFVLFLTFRIYPAKKGADAPGWYDWILIVAGVIPCSYIVFFYDLWQYNAGVQTQGYEIVLATAFVVVLLEALRRVVGMSLVVTTLFFILHPMFCDRLPSILCCRGYSFGRVMGQFFRPSQGLLGPEVEIASTIVITFLLFGQMLVYSGAGDTLLGLTFAVVGRFRGGPAKAACISSGLFGMVSGSPSANAATTGTFTVPMMKSVGYRAEVAGAIEAVAANGGQLMPPVMGVVAFIMAEMLQIPYARVCFVSFVPAFLYYIMIFLQLDFDAARFNRVGMKSSEIPRLATTLRKGYLHIVPILILIYVLFVMRYSPELSAIFATAGIVLMTLFAATVLKQPPRLTVRKAVLAFEDAAKGVVIIGLTCAMAGIMMVSVSLSGVALSLSNNIVEIAGNSLLLLLLLAGVSSFVLGLGLASIPCYIFVAIMVAPALQKVGIPEIASHLFVFWWAVASFITPPVGVSFFVAAAIARADVMKTGWLATYFGIANYLLPFAFIYNPGLLLMGSAAEVVAGIVVGLVGVTAVAAGFQGYLVVLAPLWHRLFLLSGGLLVFYPIWWTRAGAVLLIATPVVLQIRSKKLSLAGRLKAQ